MYNQTCTARLGGGVPKEDIAYVETDPSCRYGRFSEVLGKGAMKTVYKAFDEVLGMEVAWNQVKLNEVFKSPEALQRLYSEVHLLKNLNHESIIQYCTSWIDVGRRTFNFITEMFTSGTLREYRRKYPRVDIRVIKGWARQILNGLAYLHGHDPPVIHRDLKCDNVFVNGHLGQVKIGDLGLAAVLHESQHAHSVIGTPEFMAPELYEENYGELVDIYSFGMCVLEMLTSEYPYCECSNPAQIYKKVTLGKLPEVFHRIQNAEAQRFVGRCLQTASKRPPAKDLLLDPFLAIDESNLLLMSRAPPVQNLSPNGTVVDEPTRTTDMLITGTMNPGDDTVFLQVQISEEDGHVRNIHFPFSILSDTSINVALEMVKELEITDWEPLEIAEMIEEEITSVVPDRRQHSSSQLRRDWNSFRYEDEDDCDGNKRIHRFYADSSCSSSQESPLATSRFGDKKAVFNLNWVRENGTSSGGSSSNSSLSSLTYLNMNYCSGKEEEDESESRPQRNAEKTQGGSRFFGENRNDDHRQDRQPKVHRIRWLVDVRTQVLHRSLLELINKRRESKNVGSVEKGSDIRERSDVVDRVLLCGDASRGRSRGVPP